MLTIFEYSFFLMIAAYLLGALGSLCFFKKPKAANLWASFFSSLGSLSGIALGSAGLFINEAFLRIPTQLPLFSLSLHFDGLSSFFVLFFSVISFLCSIYGYGYMRKHYGEYSLGSFGFFFNVFILSLLLVVTAWNGFYFLFVWEIMSLASYFLVTFEHNKKENVKAGYLYLAMTHLATAFIIIAFLLLFRSTGSFDFSVWQSAGASLGSGVTTAVLLLAFIGFGTKSGIIPLHIWLPKAHPAAPSHVSALMSGLVIKTGVYMMLRLFLGLTLGVPVWFGYVVLVFGGLSAVLGVLYALQEHDLKKLLAYHSVENIGIILLGLGSALVFSAMGYTSYAMLGFIAALFHTLNHAVFKALLFLGAGSVFLSTHTRNIEKYGGLLRFMPYTGLTFLIGAAAISGLPPFNGFVSEWLTFQSLFFGINQTFSVGAFAVFFLSIASLALTSGLAAACFVKAFGATFLGRPRSESAETVKESSFLLLLPMGILAITSLLLGVFGHKIVSLIQLIGKSLHFSDVVSTGAVQAVIISVSNAELSYLLVFITLILIIAGVAVFVGIFSRSRRITYGRTWDCGFDLGPRMEITATSFSRSLVIMFHGLLKSTKQTDVEYHDALVRYFPNFKSVSLHEEDYYNKYFYEPLHKTALFLSNFLKRLQSGNINLYLLYIFLALFLTLFWAIN